MHLSKTLTRQRTLLSCDHLEKSVVSTIIMLQEKYFPNIVKAIQQKASRKGERETLFQRAVDEVIKTNGKRLPRVHETGYASSCELEFE